MWRTVFSALFFHNYAICGSVAWSMVYGEIVYGEMEVVLLCILEQIFQVGN